jgi:hypothetical protein
LTAKVTVPPPVIAATNELSLALATTPDAIAPDEKQKTAISTAKEGTPKC